MTTVPTTLNNLDLGTSGVAAPESGQHAEPATLPVGYEPRSRDVCCGRGKRNWNHEGNVWFRGLIQANVDRYIHAPTKTDKTAVVVSIVEQVRGEGAYFVKQEDGSGRWYDIGDSQAREKVGHSLRDQVTAQKKKEREGTSVSPIRSRASPTPPQTKQSNLNLGPPPQMVNHPSGPTAPPQLVNQQSTALRQPDMAYSLSQASVNSFNPLGLTPQVSQNMNQNSNYAYGNPNEFSFQTQQLQNQIQQNQQLQQLQRQQLQQLQNQQLQQLQPTPIQPQHQHQFPNMYQQSTSHMPQNIGIPNNSQLDYGYGTHPVHQVNSFNQEVDYFSEDIRQTRDDNDLQHRRRSRESVEVLQKFGRRPSWRAMSISSSASTKGLVRDIQQVAAEFGDDVFDDFVFDRRRSSIQPYNIQTGNIDSRRMSAMSMASALGDESFGDLDSNTGAANLPTQYNNNFRSSIRRSSVSWMKEMQQTLQQFDVQMNESSGLGQVGAGPATGATGGYNRRASALDMLEALKDVNYTEDDDL